jgi:spore maturation protein CgeE
MDIQILYKTEKAYSLVFSTCEDTGTILRFRDASIPDMYSHNFTLFTQPLSAEAFLKEIEKEIALRKKEDADYLQADCDFSLDQSVIDSLPLHPEVSVHDLMYWDTRGYADLRGNPECTVLPARSPAVLEEGRRVDFASSIGAGEDFARRRSVRKMRAYAEPNALTLYVCYYRGEPVGKVELFTSGKLAKIEDFDVLEAYQRKGVGTTAIRKMLEDACAQGVEMAYLATDRDDTAKDMYRKCGFNKAGEKTLLHFKL